MMLHRLMTPLIGAITALSAGCATDLTGLGGTSSHRCPMTDGGVCQSMSDNYAAGPLGTLGSGGAPVADASAPPASARASHTPSAPLAPSFGEAFNGAPLLAGPRVMRVYIAPWTDSDDNLMEGRRAYVRIDDGRWRLDHFKGAVHSLPGQPLRPPVQAQPAAVERGSAPGFEPIDEVGR